MSTDLVPTETDRLIDCERTIEAGLRTFEAVGEALLVIRDERLYRTTHDTFESYCQDRWNFTDRRARQMIAAAETVAALPTGTIVPTSEGQARELRGLDPDIAADVMHQAHEATDGKPTATAIRDARAHVTETTKVERDVDTATGEIVTNPIIEAVKAARSGPAHIAGNEIARIFTAVRGIKNVGGPSAVAGDLGDSQLDHDYASSLLDMLDVSLPVLTDLRGRLARRNLRSVQ